MLCIAVGHFGGRRRSGCGFSGFSFPMANLPLSDERFCRTCKGEIVEAKLRVDGLACPLCAYEMEKKLKNLPGISHLDIQLKKGVVLVKMKPGQSPTLKQIIDCVKDSGFTMRQAEITTIGQVKCFCGKNPLHDLCADWNRYT